MVSDRSATVLALAMVTVMILGSWAANVPSSNTLLATAGPSSAPLGQATTVNIGSWPNGASQQVEVNVLDGHAVSGMGLTVEPGVLPQSTAFAWDSPSEYALNTVYDGMNVNDTSLTILPQGWTYDFEGTNAWTLDTNWFLGVDTTSSRPTTSTVPSGTTTLYSHNGDYTNGMSTTYWATSPVMNCASCSGTWNLEFMRQLGVESNSWDHAYVSVKNSQGNWVNVWSNGGTINEGTFTQQVLDVSTHIANNANFQVRFGIGTSDGSVTYSGWNIDDVSVLPAASGVSSGEGNWTSAPFGPELDGRGEGMKFGFLHMDVTVNGGALFEWQLLDAVTLQPVPGFERMTATHVDLGMVDWRSHPMLRLKLHMRLGSGGGDVAVHSMGHNGHLEHGFSSDPTAAGWQLQSGSWSSGSITSNGLVYSDTYYVRSGFAAINTAMSVTGSPSLSVSVDGGLDWLPLDHTGQLRLEAPAYMAQFRMSSTSAYTWDGFEAELVRNAPARGTSIDFGLDGFNEWSIRQSGFETLGLQSMFTSGDAWSVVPTTPSSSAQFEVQLPLSGVHAFGFALASPETVLSNAFMAMAVNGQDILNRGLGNVGDLTTVTLTTSELQTLNNALSGTTNTGTSDVPTANMEVRLGSSLTSTDVLVGGVFAPFSGSVSLDLLGSHPVVVGLNDALNDAVSVGGQRTASIPVRMESTGSVVLTVDDLTSTASVRPVAQTVSNATETLVPGTEWIETLSTFDLAPLGVTSAMTHAVQSNWDTMLVLQGGQRTSSVTCSMASLPLAASAMNGCDSNGAGLLWSNGVEEGGVTAEGTGSLLEVRHRFQFPDGWDDEVAMQLSVTLVSPNGPMLPLTTTFGWGSALGVENDLSVKEWSVLNENGLRSSSNYPYLSSGELVNIEVVMGFEGTHEGTPRSGQALVRLMVDGSEYASTSLLEDGVVLFPYNIPSGRTSLDLAVEVMPLRGQNVVYETPASLSFLFDNTAPTLVGMDVERFDNRPASPVTELGFSIADRPHLPEHALANVWRSWVDDADEDGQMDTEEIMQHPLSLPTNLEDVVGEYLFRVDTSAVEHGDHFIGWLEVGDSAGHLMEDAGSFDAPLFHVQINNNGAPSLGASPMGWEDGALPWLHPGETHTVSVPVWERNGIFDLAEVELALASNTPTPTVLLWNQSAGTCTSSNVYIEVMECGLRADDAGDLFSRNGYFDATFTIEWGYDPDVSLERIPHVSLTDQSGQSNQYVLSDLAWKYSGEVIIDADSVRTSMTGEADDRAGYWLQPRTPFEVRGDVVWFRTGRVATTPLSLNLEVGEQDVTVDTVNGSFSASLIAPLLEDSYGLTASLFDEPSGAVYRGDGSALVWFIVDQAAPRITNVDRPASGSLLTEAMWSGLTFELRMHEMAQLNAASLRLHWSLNQAGLGLNSYVYDNGTTPLIIVGERTNGPSIPLRSNLNLDEIMLPAFRTEDVELRIWVTGEDRAGHPIDAVFNDVDAPLRVWALEQRVPEYTMSAIALKPSDDLHQGDAVTVGMSLSNTGLADGEANVVLELVESTGARTRLDARVMSIQAGETSLYQYVWVPSRDGTMWLEASVVGGPITQSPTVLVDEARSTGVLGVVSGMNTAMLGLFGLLVAGLVTFIAVGFRRADDPLQPKSPPSLAAAEQAGTTVPVGPYGAAPDAGRSPGENPYG